VARISTSIEEYLRVHRIAGEVTPREVAEQIRGNQTHPAQADLPALWDFSSASLSAWNHDAVLTLLEAINIRLARPAVAALVVANPETYGFVRFALALLQSRTAIEGHVFWSEVSARAWLRVREHRSSRQASAVAANGSYPACRS
jgi:hypothetical protein